jgi:hypothetical protein
MIRESPGESGHPVNLGSTWYARGRSFSDIARLFLKISDFYSLLNGIIAPVKSKLSVQFTPPLMRAAFKLVPNPYTNAKRGGCFKDKSARSIEPVRCHGRHPSQRRPPSRGRPPGGATSSTRSRERQLQGLRQAPNRCKDEIMRGPPPIRFASRNRGWACWRVISMDHPPPLMVWRTTVGQHYETCWEKLFG